MPSVTLRFALEFAVVLEGPGYKSWLHHQVCDLGQVTVYQTLSFLSCNQGFWLPQLRDEWRVSTGV